MPDLLDRIRSELDDRIAALRPLADEFVRLQRAADALDQVAAPAAAARRGPAVTPARAAAGAKPAGRRRAGRSRVERAAPGQTQLRVIEQLRSMPGSTSTAVSQALGISANAAAATISRLVKQGRVRRLDAGGYAPAPTQPDDTARAEDMAAPAEDMAAAAEDMAAAAEDMAAAAEDTAPADDTAPAEAPAPPPPAEPVP